LEALAVRIQTRIDIEKPVVEAVDPVGNPVFHKSTAQFLLFLPTNYAVEPKDY
jgi:hypothetical protein